MTNPSSSRITKTELVTMATKEDTASNPLVGVPDGFIEKDGEKVVYDYDDSGAFLGWHKETVNG